MKNPRPICPNTACVHHTRPPPGFYRKKGYRRPKHNHQPVPRYQCKACGRYFCATQVKPIRGQHRPDLNRKVFALAVSGVSMRRMAILLGCSKLTIDRKIAHLAQQAREHHAERIRTLRTSYVMVDEMETFLHSRYKQLSVPVVIRVKTGEVLAFGVARKPSNQERGWIKYGWNRDERPKVIEQVLGSVAPVLTQNATIATDSHPSYPKWIRRNLPGIKHKKLKSPNTPDYDPLFAINLAFAKMRNDLARLGRKTWTTTKSLKGLEDHLWLWIAWTNGYRLK